MKVSVVTVCLNSARTIEDTIRSVIAQEGVDVEYIVIDGGSTDATLTILDNYKDHIDVIVSEPDRGLYDAMNKGLARAAGEVVGFLNSDDVFADARVLLDLTQTMLAEKADCVFADVEFIDDAGRVSRIYSGSNFHPSKFEQAYAVPHPSFYARTDVVRAAGGFDPLFRIAGDFHLMVKMMRLNGASWNYLPRVVVHMRLGGVSTQGLKAYRISTRENITALRDCGLKPDELAIRGRMVRKGLEVVRGRFLRDRRRCGPISALRMADSRGGGGGPKPPSSDSMR